MNVNEIWEHTLPYIRQDINSTVGFNTYIKDIKPISFENDVFKISVSTTIIKSMLALRYKKNIEDAISNTVGTHINLEIIVESEEAETSKINNIIPLRNQNITNQILKAIQKHKK